jgi:uncharacterized membrane protein
MAILGPVSACLLLGVTAPGLAMLAAVPHVVLYGGLLLLFARSLRRGQMPVVMRLALMVERGMTPAMLRYTRQVTIAWAIFFVAMIGAGCAIAVAAPVRMAVLMMLDLPLVALMFALEYAVRRLRFPAHQHVSLACSVRVFLRSWRQLS